MELLEQCVIYLLFSEQELLFREFLTRTFPYPKLKKPAYVQFLIEWGWPKEHMNALFR